MTTRRVPDDDLYARLQVPFDATGEAIEVAWRALLKRHHPDVAGEPGLEATKRINVAHDWLADPELRAHYDRARWPVDAARATAHGRAGARPAWASEGRAAGWRPAGWTEPASPPWSTWRPSGRATGRARAGGSVRPGPGAADPAILFERLLDRAGRLSGSEIDRLAMAEPHAIAFVASLERILPPDRQAALAAAERRLRDRLPAAAWSQLPVRDAVLAVAVETTVGPLLDELLPEPSRGRIRDRLLRAWEAAIDQPRYGPNTPIVERVRARAGRLSGPEARALVRAAGPAAGPILDGEAGPWPFGEDPADDEALRVSAALAARDVAAAPDLGDLTPAIAARARRVLTRTGHAVALRHGFTAAAYAELVAPWRSVTGDPATGRAPAAPPEPTVRRA